MVVFSFAFILFYFFFSCTCIFFSSSFSVAIFIIPQNVDNVNGTVSLILICIEKSIKCFFLKKRKKNSIQNSSR